MKKWQKFYTVQKPVVLAVNKVDNPEMRANIYDFYALGFGEPFPISGTHGLGLGDLLDAVSEHFKTYPRRSMRMKSFNFASSAGRTSENPPL